MEKQAFVTKLVYQTRLENKAKHNIPPIMMIHTKMRITTIANVLQNNESITRQSWHNM